MLLTLSKPAKPDFEYKTHEYSPTFSSSTSARFSPKFNGGPVSSLPVSASSSMGTPHRGLPPPSAMTLPDPGRGPPPMPSHLGSLPPAPPSWQGAEDSGMKNWLVAKAEEDKKKQEEERTRQETLRLEQRKIEQSMLRESIQGGIPPHLVPMIFAGIGGGNLATMTAEWIQQYSAQLQTAQQQQTQQTQHQGQLSPELRREARMIGQVPPAPYGAGPQTPQAVLPPTSVLPGQPLPTQPQHGAFSGSSYTGGNMSPRARAAQAAGHVGAPTSAPRPPPPSSLPRLTTNEMHIQAPPTAPSNVQQLQSQSAQQEQSSPSIYFHHWVPPSSQQEKSSSGNPPATPSGKYKASPSSLPRQRAASHASDPEYTSSPKKRKAQGGHPAPPPPTSAPQPYTSPSFSQVSTSSTSTPGRRGHARARSDVSARGDSHGSSLSRRGTVSSHTHAEAGAQQADGSEQRYQPPPRGAEGHIHQQPQHQQHEQAYPSPQQRNDGRGYSQQARAASPIAYHSETRQSGPHPQLAGHGQGSVPTSPKREIGAQ